MAFGDQYQCLAYAPYLLHILNLTNMLVVLDTVLSEISKLLVDSSSKGLWSQVCFITTEPLTYCTWCNHSELAVLNLCLLLTVLCNFNLLGIDMAAQVRVVGVSYMSS